MARGGFGAELMLIASEDKGWLMEMDRIVDRRADDAQCGQSIKFGCLSCFIHEQCTPV